MHHISLVVQCKYGSIDEGGEDIDGKEGSEVPGGWERESRDFLALASYIQMTWFFVVSRRMI